MVRNCLCIKKSTNCLGEVTQAQIQWRIELPRYLYLEQTALGKLLWNLCKKKDRLWVLWVHSYYGKQSYVWGVQVKQASWMVQRILKVHKYLQEAGYSEQDMITMDKYSIKEVYQQMRGSMERVEWRKLVWANLGAPKWLFILYIALNRRLTDEVTCPLCQVSDEDIDHLFFKCSCAEKVWNKLLGWQGIQRQSMNWQEEVRWALRNMKGKNSKMQVYRMTLAGALIILVVERKKW